MRPKDADEQKSPPIVDMKPALNPLIKLELPSAKRTSSSLSKDASKRPRALDEIRDEEERRRESANRKDHWLTPGLVVKIVTKKLGDDYHKAKGDVVELVDPYTAMVRVKGKKGENHSFPSLQSVQTCSVSTSRT